MASRHILLLNDELNKETSFLFQEAKTWKCSAESIKRLKRLYGLQLVLHLSEGSKIRHQIFHTIDMEDMQHENGWNTVISLLEKKLQKQWYCSSIQYLGKTWSIITQVKTINKAYGTL